MKTEAMKEQLLSSSYLSEPSQNASVDNHETKTNSCNNPDRFPIEDGIDEQNDYHCWEPSGNRWQDISYFIGPGWLVSIAYVDPGNYQADIQAGATSGYSLLWVVLWTSLLSIYVQVLCVRLAYYGQVTLAEAIARDNKESKTALGQSSRFVNWLIAEFSVVITDLPEVIGFAIACNIFFGWPYYVGVVLSLLTTMLFLSVLHKGLRFLEYIIVFFVGVMSIALWVELGVVGVNGGDLVEGTLYGFIELSWSDLSSVTGILGAVVMPHNLYLHSASCMSRRVKREEDVVQHAVKWSSIEPAVPIVVSFFVNMALVSIAAQLIYMQVDYYTAEDVGITDFCTYFLNLDGGCILWGVALLAAGQSSAITTTFAGQYIMDGFLNIQLSLAGRAIVTRLVAITPCVIVSILFPNSLNIMVDYVNSSLSLLLPFAFTPLVKYNCSEAYMGKYASKGVEKLVLYLFAILVWLINAVSLSSSSGGFFGAINLDSLSTTSRIIVILCEVGTQILFFWWIMRTLFTSVNAPMTPFEQRRDDPQFALVLS